MINETLLAEAIFLLQRYNSVMQHSIIILLLIIEYSRCIETALWPIRISSLLEDEGNDETRRRRDRRIVVKLSLAFTTLLV